MAGTDGQLEPAAVVDDGGRTASPVAEQPPSPLAPGIRSGGRSFGATAEEEEEPKKLRSALKAPGSLRPQSPSAIEWGLHARPPSAPEHLRRPQKHSSNYGSVRGGDAAAARPGTAPTLGRGLFTAAPPALSRSFTLSAPRPPRAVSRSSVPTSLLRRSAPDLLGALTDLGGLLANRYPHLFPAPDALLAAVLHAAAPAGDSLGGDGVSHVPHRHASHTKRKKAAGAVATAGDDDTPLTPQLTPLSPSALPGLSSGVGVSGDDKAGEALAHDASPASLPRPHTAASEPVGSVSPPKMRVSFRLGGPGSATVTPWEPVGVITPPAAKPPLSGEDKPLFGAGGGGGMRGRARVEERMGALVLKMPGMDQADMGISRSKLEGIKRQVHEDVSREISDGSLTSMLLRKPAAAAGAAASSFEAVTLAQSLAALQSRGSLAAPAHAASSTAGAGGSSRPPREPSSESLAARRLSRSASRTSFSAEGGAARLSRTSSSGSGRLSRQSSTLGKGPNPTSAPTDGVATSESDPAPPGTAETDESLTARLATVGDDDGEDEPGATPSTAAPPALAAAALSLQREASVDALDSESSRFVALASTWDHPWPKGGGDPAPPSAEASDDSWGVPRPATAPEAGGGSGGGGEGEGRGSGQPGTDADRTRRVRTLSWVELDPPPGGEADEGGGNDEGTNMRPPAGTGVAAVKARRRRKRGGSADTAARGGLSSSHSLVSLGGATNGVPSPERSWQEVLGLAKEAKPWRHDPAKDTVWVAWQRQRERQMRHEWALQHAKVMDDLDFLSAVAVRMRRRNKKLEAEEARLTTEAASKIAAVFVKRRANPFARPRTTKQGQEALITKWMTFCGAEVPPLPGLPTLPRVCVGYAVYLHEESRLTSASALAPHFAAINLLHKNAGLDPPCVEPAVRAAFKQAIKRPGEIPKRAPPERRAPIHPRFVVKMIDLATSSLDDHTRRCCVYTVLSYACICRRGLNHMVPLGDVVVDRDGTVRVYERDTSSMYAADAAAVASIAFPHAVYRRPMRPHVEGWGGGVLGGGAGGQGAAGAYGRASSAPPGRRSSRLGSVVGLTGASAADAAATAVGSSTAGGGSEGGEPGVIYSKLSIRDMVTKYLTTQRAAGVGDHDPLFWLPAVDAHKPELHDSVSHAWVRHALDAALAYPPAGEHWNNYSLRSGALTAAFVVGVDLYACQLRGGFQEVPRREVEKCVDVLQEPSFAGDFLFGHMRKEGRPLSSDQRAILVDEPQLLRSKNRPAAVTTQR